MHREKLSFIVEFMWQVMYDNDLGVRFLSILFIIRSYPKLFLFFNLLTVRSSLGVYRLMELVNGYYVLFLLAEFVFSFWFVLFSSVVKQFSKYWVKISHFSMLVSYLARPFFSGWIVLCYLVILLVAIHRLESLAIIFIWFTWIIS